MEYTQDDYIIAGQKMAHIAALMTDQPGRYGLCLFHQPVIQALEVIDFDALATMLRLAGEGMGTDWSQGATRVPTDDHLEGTIGEDSQ